MGFPTQDLNQRLEVAGTSAQAATERGIARVRGWCLVVALIQTALYPGQFWYLAWGAMAILLLTWAWARWALQPGAGRPRVQVVGVLAMVADSLAVIMVMTNLMASANDPIQLLPVALVIEAAVRWGRPGGIVAGVTGGLLLTGWSAGTHYRNDLPYSVGDGFFRWGVVVLIGVGIGNAMKEMRQQRRAAVAVFEASRDLMATCATDGTVLAANPAWETIVGYSPQVLSGGGDSVLSNGQSVGLGEILADGARRVVRPMSHLDGHQLWVELDLVPDKKAGLIYAIGRDVSDRSRTESELRHRVDHDSLTGSWNRLALVNYLHRMLQRGYLPGLVFIDLDRFKAINDEHGHLIGDRVIVEVAERLSAATGHEGTVARYAGDEFCIVVDDPEEVETVTERVRRCFDDPFVVGGVELVVNGAVGQATGRSGDTPDLLVHRADQDMYQVKGVG